MSLGGIVAGAVGGLANAGIRQAQAQQNFDLEEEKAALAEARAIRLDELKEGRRRESAKLDREELAADYKSASEEASGGYAEKTGRTVSEVNDAAGPKMAEKVGQWMDSTKGEMVNDGVVGRNMMAKGRITEGKAIADAYTADKKESRDEKNDSARLVNETRRTDIMLAELADKIKTGSLERQAKQLALDDHATLSKLRDELVNATESGDTAKAAKAKEKIHAFQTKISDKNRYAMSKIDNLEGGQDLVVLDQQSGDAVKLDPKNLQPKKAGTSPGPSNTGASKPTGAGPWDRFKGSEVLPKK